MPLAVIQNHAEVFCGGVGVKGFAVRKNYILAQVEDPDFTVR